MEIVVRAAVMFVFLWFGLRVMGKRELAEMSAFEMVLLVTIGDLVQQGVTQDDASLTGSVLAVGTIALCVVAVSWITTRWSGPRQLIDGAPVVIVAHGHVLTEVLRQERMPVEDLHEAARNQGIADLSTVKWVLLEPDGKFSFLDAPETSETSDASETSSAS